MENDDLLIEYDPILSNIGRSHGANVGSLLFTPQVPNVDRVDFNTIKFYKKYPTYPMIVTI
jgi:hypothetical protein